MQRLGTDELMVISIEQAGDRAPEAGEHKAQPLNQPHIVTQRAHASWLVASALQALPECRLDETCDAPQPYAEKGQSEVIEGGWVHQIEAKGLWPPEPAQPVVAAGQAGPSIGNAPQD